MRIHIHTRHFLIFLFCDFGVFFFFFTFSDILFSFRFFFLLLLCFFFFLIGRGAFWSVRALLLKLSK